MNKINPGIRLVLSLLFFLALLAGRSQDVVNEFQERFYFDLGIKPIKQLQLEFIPEVRFEDDFSVDEYLLETELTYKPFRFLHLGGNYRFIINIRNNKETEYLNRYAIFTRFQKDIRRMTPSIRIMYTNYTDDDLDGKYMRYKAMLKYNIPKCKLTPYLSAELFQHLEDNMIYKLRYKLKLAYEIFKNNFLEVSYRLDNYVHADRNRHIISLGYELKL